MYFNIITVVYLLLTLADGRARLDLKRYVCRQEQPVSGTHRRLNETPASALVCYLNTYQPSLLFTALR